MTQGVLKRDEQVRLLARIQMRQALRRALYLAAIAGASTGMLFDWSGLTLPAILVWLDLYTADTIRLAAREVKRAGGNVRPR